jgi:cell division protein FtsI (penicillin-binding protein 3)
MTRNLPNGSRWNGTVRRRIRFLAVLLPFLLLLPAARAFHLQIYEREDLSRKADRQSRIVEKVNPRRGAIVDRNGQPLAISVPVPSIYARREMVLDKRSATKKLSRILDMDARTLYSRLSKGSGFVWLKRMVEPSVAQRVVTMEVEGIGLRTESRRYYPNTDLAGSVLGFVGTDMGLEGLENSLEEHLRGGDGTRILNLDAWGKKMSAASPDERPPEVGSTVQLTLDRNIQFFVEQSLREGSIRVGAKGGAAIILESLTGRILAMASYPGFNPNNFRDFRQSTYRNKAVNFVYEPGSTFKVITIAAALEEGIFDEMDILFCNNGRFKMADVVINDHVPHGWLTLMGIIRKSSNIGASKVGLKLGRDNLGKYVRAFGFGRKTGILLPGEGMGILRDDGVWTQVDLANISFGQGLGVTPIQMVNAVNAVATGGELLRPYLVERITAPSGEVVLQTRPGVHGRVVSKDTARKVMRMMEAVTEPGGSGLNAAITGYRVAGKTGTAQKFELKKKTYSSEKFIASFTGFAPSRDPAITAIVMVDEPKESIYGGAVAAPIWRDMVGKTLKYLNVTPFKPEESPNADEPDVKVVKLRQPVENDNQETMPDLRGLTLREALGRIGDVNVPVRVKGTGVVVHQVPAPGSGFGGPVSLNLMPRTAS